MKRILLLGAVACSLSGCEDLIFVPVAAVVLPFYAAGEAVYVSSSVRQPVEVVSASGTRLAGPISDKAAPAAQFRAGRGTVKCSGTSAERPEWISGIKIPVACSNGMRGAIYTEGNLSAGYRFSMSVDNGKAAYECTGYYYGSGGKAGPFLTECRHKRNEWMDFSRTKRELTLVGLNEGAALAGPSASGRFSVTAWVAPL